MDGVVFFYGKGHHAVLLVPIILVYNNTHYNKEGFLNKNEKIEGSWPFREKKLINDNYSVRKYVRIHSIRRSRIR